MTLLTNKPLDRRVHFHIDESSIITSKTAIREKYEESQNTTLPTRGQFTVSQIGDIIIRKPLDYEQYKEYSFLVRVMELDA